MANCKDGILSSQNRLSVERIAYKILLQKEVTYWQSVYYHFNKWAKLGIWENVWKALLSLHKGKLDLSSAQLDGSHTIAKQGGEAVAYQGRKKAKTCNSLFLADSKGQILAMSEPVSGNHHDFL